MIEPKKYNGLELFATVNTQKRSIKEYQIYKQNHYKQEIKHLLMICV